MLFRSPLSPLLPSSPLYPDNLISHHWFEKISSSEAFAMLYIFSTTDTTSLKSDIHDLMTEYKDFGTHIALVALLPDEDTSWADRNLQALAETQNGRISVITVTPPEFASVNTLQGRIFDRLNSVSQDYYADLAKRVRRRKGRTVPQHGPLDQKAWLTRYDIKLGAIAEIRGLLEESIKSYVSGYKGIVNHLNAHSTNFTTLSTVLDSLCLKICKLNMYMGDYTNAATSYSNHHALISSTYSRLSSNTADIRMILARNAKIFGRYGENLEIDVPNISVSNASVIACIPQQTLQNPGIYHLQAASSFDQPVQALESLSSANASFRKHFYGRLGALSAKKQAERQYEIGKTEAAIKILLNVSESVRSDGWLLLLRTCLDQLREYIADNHPVLQEKIDFELYDCRLGGTEVSQRSFSQDLSLSTSEFSFFMEASFAFGTHQVRAVDTAIAQLYLRSHLWPSISVTFAKIIIKLTNDIEVELKNVEFLGQEEKYLSITFSPKILGEHTLTSLVFEVDSLKINFEASEVSSSRDWLQEDSRTLFPSPSLQVIARKSRLDVSFVHDDTIYCSEKLTSSILLSNREDENLQIKMEISLESDLDHDGKVALTESSFSLEKSASSQRKFDFQAPSIATDLWLIVKLSYDQSGIDHSRECRFPLSTIAPFHVSADYLPQPYHFGDVFDLNAPQLSISSNWIVDIKIAFFGEDSIVISNVEYNAEAMICQAVSGLGTLNLGELAVFIIG